MKDSHISWTNDTFNPWIGCTKVSPACDGCYAEHLMDHRLHRVVWGAPGEGAGTRVRTSVANWREPLKWEREQAAAIGRWQNSVLGVPADRMEGCPPPPPPRFVFCASLADVFDNEVPVEWRRDLFDLIRATPHLTWLLLTKRPQNILKLFAEIMNTGLPLEVYWPKNAALGTTIEDRARLKLNARPLSYAGAVLNPAFLFWSCEPLLEDLGDISGWLADARFADRDQPAGVRWVITGGETDQGAHMARPTPPDAFRSIRDQCAKAGVAYHHKQNGEWAFLQEVAGPHDKAPTTVQFHTFDGGQQVMKYGKTATGRMLDGVIHDARPAVRP